MPGLSVKLPLSLDFQDGYATNKSYNSLARQNLKMLILTSPGERIMYPMFGVGIKRYLFSNYSKETFSSISANIRSQAGRYLPYLKITNIEFDDGSADSSNALIDNNMVIVKISYIVTPTRSKSVLSLTI